MENIALIGIDLGKNSFHIHCQDRRGKAVYRKKFTRSKLIEFLATCPATTIAMEACGGSHFMARELEELGHFPKLDTNLAGPVRQSIYTKTGTPVRQVGRLGPGVTVPEKQLCSDLRSGKQAGQNSLGTDNTTADLRSITANKPV